jgi:long-chain acyl-CoA synthetase
MLTDAATFDDEALLTHCRKALSAFKIPQRVNVVADIDMTGSGKVRR